MNIRENSVESVFNKEVEEQFIPFKPIDLKTIRTDISCESHSEEPVMYFCFTCQSYCFCA